MTRPLKPGAKFKTGTKGYRYVLLLDQKIWKRDGRVARRDTLQKTFVFLEGLSIKLKFTTNKFIQKAFLLKLTHY